VIKAVIVKAYEFARKKHEGQKRKCTNLDFFTHPKGVARIIEKLTNDENIIASSLLHDILEDTDTTEMDLRIEFTDEIADLVKELTNDPQERGLLKKYEYLRMKMSKMSSSALLIKLADLFHNIRFIERDYKPDDEESVEFADWLYKKTKLIVDNLEEVIDAEINDKHKVLLSYIRTILEFYRIQHSK
jgi:(p)ppGpp synthase/HD superfamily hydrolase